MEKTEETKYGYSEAIQKKIVAMMLFDKAAFIENSDIVRPEFFDNPILKSLAEIIRKFYEKYHKIPTQEEFIQEADTLVASNKHLPRNDYGDIIEEILTMGATESFEYVKDKAVEFAKFQAVKTALIDSAKTLQKSRDYGKINKSIADALLIGETDFRRDEVLNTEQLLDREYEPRDIFVPNWVERRAVTVLAGDTKIGKSLLTLNLALALQFDETFLGEDVLHKNPKILVLQQEVTAPAMQERILKILQVKSLDVLPEASQKVLKNITFKNRARKFLKLNDPSGRAAIHNLIKEHKPDIVIFDPLSTFNAKEEVNKYLAPLMDDFFTIADRFNCAVLIVHHFRKPQKGEAEINPKNKMRGGTEIPNRADILIMLEPLPRQFKNMKLRLRRHLYVELNFDNRNSGKADNLLIERDEDSLKYTISTELGEVTGRKLEVREVCLLIEATGGEIPRQRLLELLTVDKIVGMTTAKKRIEEAIEKGHIKQIPLEGKGMPVGYQLTTD